MANSKKKLKYYKNKKLEIIKVYFVIHRGEGVTLLNNFKRSQ